MKREASGRGVESERLIFSKNCDYSQYLSRLKVADLYVDTFTFNAGAMANDALWSGLPVLTYQGNSYVARMASSLLAALGQDQLITQSYAEYEKMALHLATSKIELKKIKSRLEIAKKISPVFDPQRCTRNLERAYVEIYDRNQNPNFE